MPKTQTYFGSPSLTRQIQFHPPVSAGPRLDAGREMIVVNDEHSNVFRFGILYVKSLGINYVPGTLCWIQYESQKKTDYGFSVETVIFLGNKELKHEPTGQQCNLAK